MRWGRVCICFILLTAFISEMVEPSTSQMLSSKYRDYDRTRSTRGIKSGVLNSARGFGKRSSLHKIDQRSIPVEWMADELTSNPELSQLLIRQFIDLDRDGLLSPFELLRRLNHALPRPLYKNKLA